MNCHLIGDMDGNVRNINYTLGSTCVVNSEFYNLIPFNIEKMLPFDKSSDYSSDDVSMAEAKPAFLKVKHSLYLRFVGKLDQNRDKASADIKKLHNKIIKVRIPRQKAANYCLVDFGNEKDCIAAVKQLRATQFRGKNILVKSATCNKSEKVKKIAVSIQEKRVARSALQKLVGNIINVHTADSRRSVTSIVCVKDLPRSIKEADVESQFSEPLEIRVIVPKLEQKKALAFITLPSPKDALAATMKKVNIRGVSYKVLFARDDADVNVKSEKRKSKKADRYFQQIDEIKTEIKEEVMDEDEKDGIQMYN